MIQDRFKKRESKTIGILETENECCLIKFSKTVTEIQVPISNVLVGLTVGLTTFSPDG